LTLAIRQCTHSTILLVKSFGEVRLPKQARRRNCRFGLFAKSQVSKNQPKESNGMLVDRARSIVAEREFHSFLAGHLSRVLV
jgi:hypothetical protein